MFKKIRSDRSFGMALAVMVVGVLLLGASPNCQHHSSGNTSGGGLDFSSRAYKGHDADADINNFIVVNQAAWGTRLDDCQTCHWGQEVVNDKSVAVTPNPCSYCHLIIHPPAGWTGLPTSVFETLNPYGRDYLAFGRTRGALVAIQNRDSDGDTYSNLEEINDLRYPGNPNSYPGLAQCAIKTVTMAQIKAMPAHTQFGLANAERQQYDFYATYTGVKIKDLIASQGISTATATGVDILSPDGYQQFFTMDRINNQFPAHQFFPGLDMPNYDSACALVEYPANTYSYGSGDYITDEQWHILAYAREGLPLDPSYLDPVSGKINGEGPFRNVIPPWEADPLLNRPDRGSRVGPGCPDPQWDYSGANAHNAGYMNKAAVILRIQPMPTDCEEFDLINGGFAMVADETILIYGHGVE